jgi:Triose-phosphate Transporter family.
VISSLVENPYLSHKFTLGLLEGAILASSMEFAEFMVVSQTSSLTLSIVGIVKVSQGHKLLHSSRVRFRAGSKFFRLCLEFGVQSAS